MLRFLTDEDQEDWDESKKPPDLKRDYLKYHALLLDPQQRLQGLDSIETFVFTNPARQEAEQPQIAQAIKKAEVVFLAGGDQCNAHSAGWEEQPIIF